MHSTLSCLLITSSEAYSNEKWSGNLANFLKSNEVWRYDKKKTDLWANNFAKTGPLGKLSGGLNLKICSSISWKIYQYKNWLVRKFEELKCNSFSLQSLQRRQCFCGIIYKWFPHFQVRNAPIRQRMYFDCLFTNLMILQMLDQVMG